MTTVRKARGHVRTYGELHRDSPIAAAFDDCGPCMVVDNVRADIAHGVSRKDLARAYQIGICSASRGFAPDVHQHASGLWPDLTPADYLVRWIETGCRWHVSGGSSNPYPACSPDAEDQYNADRSARLDQWAAELVVIAPSWYVDWLARLLHVPKWELLVEMGAHAWLSEGSPADPKTDWSIKMFRQWARRFESAEIVRRVTTELEQF